MKSPTHSQSVTARSVGQWLHAVAGKPPSTGLSAPVMYADSSASRKTTSSATSSTWLIRPSGAWATLAHLKASGAEAVIGRPDVPGVNGIHTYFRGCGLDVNYQDADDSDYAGWLGRLATWLAELYRVAQYASGRLCLNVPLDRDRGGWQP